MNLVDSRSDHDYFMPPSSNLQFSQTYVSSLEKELVTLQQRCEELQEKFQSATENVVKLKKAVTVSRRKLTISDICDSDDLIKLYAGILSYSVFKWYTPVGLLCMVFQLF